MDVPSIQEINVDMVFEQSRLKTFSNWVYLKDKKHSCTPEKMAQAGFYFIGNEEDPDLVKCFVCGKELNGWSPEDDPFVEHKSHASYCPFVKLGKKESQMTISEYLDVVKEMLIKHSEFWYETMEKHIKLQSDRFKKKISNEMKELKIK